VFFTLARRTRTATDAMDGAVPDGAAPQPRLEYISAFSSTRTTPRAGKGHGKQPRHPCRSLASPVIARSGVSAMPRAQNVRPASSRLPPDTPRRPLHDYPTAPTARLRRDREEVSEPRARQSDVRSVRLTSGMGWREPVPQVHRSCGCWQMHDEQRTALARHGGRTVSRVSCMASPVTPDLMAAGRCRRSGATASTSSSRFEREREAKRRSSLLRMLCGGPGSSVVLAASRSSAAMSFAEDRLSRRQAKLALSKPSTPSSLDRHV